MKITFLGTAAATGMPLPFCGCETCRQARRLGGKDIRRRACLLINEELLIDLGPDAPAACSRYAIDLSKIRYLLQTHAHSDHFDAGHFITRHPDYAVKEVSPLLLAASPATLRAMNEALRWEDGGADLFSSDFQRLLRFSLQPVSPFETIRLGDYTVTGLDALHDARQQALIYLIERDKKRLLYGTDLCRLSEENFRWLKGRPLDLLILDQTYGEGHNAGGHLDAGQVIKTLHRLAAQGSLNSRSRCYVTHLSHEGNPVHRQLQRQTKSHGYSAAYDGLTLHI
ncbi:MAG: MBL fold metallo-hydrolase [Provencibacterium sp.]|nr:MBL fold metallo-hydrolase [Provencibacterium sp.]